MRRRTLATACAAAAMSAGILFACVFETEESPARVPEAGPDTAEPQEDAHAQADADAGGVDADVEPPLVIEDAGPDAEGGLAVNPPNYDGGKAFDFAPPYVATLGPSSRSDAGHNFPANNPPSNPWRTRCVDCHKPGAVAASRPFFAAGSVYRQADGGVAAMAEVRLKRFINANAVSAYTDNDGNWFVTAGAAQDAGVGFALRPGIRDATRVRTMGPSPAIGVCNQCHGGANYL